MTEIIVLPGIGGSGSQHWQTLWQNQNAGIVRFEPSDWHAPELDDWLAALDRAVNQARTPPILIAHSLACLLVAHWAAREPAPIAGAFLVSVPDPSTPVFPAEASSFANPPAAPFPFPALIVASTNDPYGNVDYMRKCGGQWAATLVEVGPLGHINGASGVRDWPQGWALFEAFREEEARTSRSRRYVRRT